MLDLAEIQCGLVLMGDHAEANLPRFPLGASDQEPADLRWHQTTERAGVTYNSDRKRDGKGVDVSQ